MWQGKKSEYLYNVKVKFVQCSKSRFRSMVRARKDNSCPKYSHRAKGANTTNRQEAGTEREIGALVRIAYPSKSNDQELLGNSYNYYLSVCVHAPCHANESRSNTSSWNFFSPATFLWILEIDFRSSGLCFQPLCPLSWLSCWLQ